MATDGFVFLHKVVPHHSKAMNNDLPTFFLTLIFFGIHIQAAILSPRVAVPEVLGGPQKSGSDPTGGLKPTQRLATNACIQGSERLLSKAYHCPSSAGPAESKAHAGK